LAEDGIERSDRAGLVPRNALNFMALGERYPDIAGEIYIVARSPSGSARS
jgi:hypothetical protein